MIASATFAFASVNAQAEDAFDVVYETEITGINNEQYVSSDYSFVMILGETDFMTAEGWSEEGQNYKWFNADEGRADYQMVDPNEYNLCNFPLDQNLEELNYDQMILIDGVALADFGATHPYRFIGNMRQRINTLAICFDEPVLKTVTTIEILEGCQLPTLSRACVGSRNTSCIQINNTVKYENRDGLWITYFEGYQEGVEYDGDENAFKLSPETTYKNHNAVPLNNYADVFKVEETLAGGLYRGIALASGSNTQKGYITVLRFINPIDSNEFATINLRLYTNHKRSINSYNDNNVTESSLGSALESFALDGAVHTTVSLTSSLYADQDGMVRTIVFKFNEDGEPFINKEGNELYDDNGNLIRDQLFFVSFNLVKEKSSELLTKDSFMIVENDDTFDVSLRFNKECENWAVALDTSKVVLNGQSLSKVLAECKTATAKWEKVGSMCQISVTIPKSYAGSAQIKNAEDGYFGNSMGVLKGLKYPDGSELGKGYTCHIYATEKILDSDLGTKYDKTSVLDVKYDFVKGSNNLHFAIRFDKKITSANYYHACEIERWREKDLYASNPLYYDAGISAVFVKNGFKSSLLDNIVINGKTIADWHASDVNALTNVQTHYGASGLEYVDINFESNSAVSYNKLAELVQSGNGITIEIKEGLKFMTNCSVQKTQIFELKDGAFIEVIKGKTLHVYYDGSEVENGANVIVKTAVCPSSVLVSGTNGYSVAHTTNGKTTEFTITCDDGQTFTFSVTEDSVASESNKSNESASGGGCGSSVELPMIATTLIAIALVVLLKERRKYE